MVSGFFFLSFFRDCPRLVCVFGDDQKLLLLQSESKCSPWCRRVSVDRKVKWKRNRKKKKNLKWWEEDEMEKKRRRTVSICYTHADGETETERKRAIERERIRHHTDTKLHTSTFCMYTWVYSAFEEARSRAAATMSYLYVCEWVRVDEWTCVCVRAQFSWEWNRNEIKCMFTANLTALFSEFSF